MPDYIPLENDQRWRVPDDLVEARRADVILISPEKEGVVLQMVTRFPVADDEEGTVGEVVAHAFMPRESFETWARSLSQTLDLWRDMGL